MPIMAPTYPLKVQKNNGDQYINQKGFTRRSYKSSAIMIYSSLMLFVVTKDLYTMPVFSVTPQFAVTLNQIQFFFLIIHTSWEM